MKFTIYTFGCKVNQYESNMMKENLLHHNFSYVENPLDADIFIINTCTVTDTADKKCLKLVKRYLRNYPDKISVVLGCSVQNKPEMYEKLGIDIILGTKDKSKIADILTNYIKDKNKVVSVDKSREKDFEDMEISQDKHARAFIKIEDGCDNFCSYCIIPYVRGSVRSKDHITVLKEACALAQTHKEIILTGIHTGHYLDGTYDLSDLIADLSKIDGLERIRVSSIEVTELNEKFLKVLKNTPKLCSHLHIPLQAGSDKVLKLMNRKYDLAYFENKLQEIRNIRPDISITTDIIVGFPNETEEDFNETLINAEKFGFSKIHVFPFSPREGTVAAKMENQVDEKTKKDRVKRLMALSTKLEDAYYHKFKGQEVDILVEKHENNKSYGHTNNYLEVVLDEELEIGRIYKRKL